jgi:hypothetical protein
MSVISPSHIRDNPAKRVVSARAERAEAYAWRCSDHATVAVVYR